MDIQFYTLIKELAAREGLSIAMLESRLCLTKGSINKWDKSLPRVDKLQLVAKYFGISLDELFMGNVAYVNKTSVPIVDRDLTKDEILEIKDELESYRDYLIYRKKLLKDKV